MTEAVECYAGSTYPEHPRAFEYDGIRYTVGEIIDRRRNPDGVGFLVRCSSPTLLFDLYYRVDVARWLISPRASTLREDDLRN